MQASVSSLAFSSPSSFLLLLFLLLLLSSSSSLPPLFILVLTRATLLVNFYLHGTFTNSEGSHYVIPTIISIQSQTTVKKLFSKCIMHINLKEKVAVA